MVRIWSDVREDMSNQDGFAIERFLVDKLAAAVFELADHGLGHDTVFTVGKIEAPLMGLGIVKTQFISLSAPLGRRVELHQVGAAIPHLSDDDKGFHFDPASGAS